MKNHPRKSSAYFLTMSTTFLNRTQFRSLYGKRVYYIAKKLERLYVKQSKLEEHINFLKACKSNNLIPNGLQLKDTTRIYKNSQILQSTMSSMRNNLLEFQCKQKRLNAIEINTQISILQWYLKDVQPQRKHNEDLKWINKRDGRPRLKMKTKHQKKITKTHSAAKIQ